MAQTMHPPLRYAAFTDDPGGGNPAGVVLGAPLPTEAEMQRIAADIGYSETAFVAPASTGGTRDIRYFSPEAEVPFCGHATIAAAIALAERDADLSSVGFATRSETVPVTIDRDLGRPVATLTSPPTSHEAVPGEVLDLALAAFGWSRDDLDPNLPPAVASAGVTHLILPLGEERTLSSMAYRFEDLRQLMLRQGWTTVDVVWHESEAVFQARNPFPVGGVVEDPATGAAAAALGGYLRDAGVVSAPARLTVLQGHHMGRPSRITVDLHPGQAGIAVSGGAVDMTAAAGASPLPSATPTRRPRPPEGSRGRVAGAGCLSSPRRGPRR